MLVDVHVVGCEIEKTIYINPSPITLKNNIFQRRYMLIIAYRQQKKIESFRQDTQWAKLGETLHKAWLGYCIAVNKNEGEKTLYYASIIQKLQRELGIQVREFAEVDMFGSVIDKEESSWPLLIHSLMKSYRMQKKTKTIM